MIIRKSAGVPGAFLAHWATPHNQPWETRPAVPLPISVLQEEFAYETQHTCAHCGLPAPALEPLSPILGGLEPELASSSLRTPCAVTLLGFQDKWVSCFSPLGLDPFSAGDPATAAKLGLPLELCTAAPGWAKNNHYRPVQGSRSQPCRPRMWNQGFLAHSTGSPQPSRHLVTLQPVQHNPVSDLHLTSSSSTQLHSPGIALSYQLASQEVWPGRCSKETHSKADSNLCPCHSQDAVPVTQTGFDCSSSQTGACSSSSLPWMNKSLLSLAVHTTGQPIWQH